MKVKNILKVEEVNGIEPKYEDRKMLEISSHWNRQSSVVIEYEGLKLTLDVGMLCKAIANASNWRSY